MGLESNHIDLESLDLDLKEEEEGKTQLLNKVMAQSHIISNDKNIINITEFTRQKLSGF